MAGGLSTVLLRLQEATELGLFVPSWPPSEPRFCAYPDFPNNFGRSILRRWPVTCRSGSSSVQVALYEGVDAASQGLEPGRHHQRGGEVSNLTKGRSSQRLQPSSLCSASTAFFEVLCTQTKSQNRPFGGCA